MACSLGWISIGRTGKAKTAVNGFEAGLKEKNFASMWKHFSDYREVFKEQRSEHPNGSNKRVDYGSQEKKLENMVLKMSEAAYEKIESADSYSSELNTACGVLDRCLWVNKELNVLDKKKSSRYRVAIDEAVEKFSD